MYRALYTRILFLQHKLLPRLSSSYNFEMPEVYQKSLYLANASFHDNVNWYYYRAIEIAFDRFIKNNKTGSPSSREEDVVRNVLNKINMMEFCSYVMEINFPVIRDSGRVEMVKGYCAKHGVHYPTHLGGLRISPYVEKSQLKALAALASFKHICADVPFAGSHTGIKINPSEYSDSEIRRLASTFTNIVTSKNFFGPQVNILEPDLNCSGKIIDTIVEEITRIKGVNNGKNLACITGKSFTDGGLYNYNESIADGIFYGIDNFIRNPLFMYKINEDPCWEAKTYIIKSLDKVGINLVKYLSREGAKCVGVSESDVSYYNKEGINIEEAVEYKTKHGSLVNYFPLYNENKIMNEKCELLIITDSLKKLDCYIAPIIQAKIIVEAASGAITPTAHKILLAKGKLVIPDVYINSGSSIASYIEYIKNMDSSVQCTERESTRNLLFMSNSGRPYLQKEMTPLVQYRPELQEDSNERDFLKPAIKLRMNSSVRKIMKILREYNLQLDIRTAAYIMASEKIFELLQNDKYL